MHSSLEFDRSRVSLISRAAKRNLLLMLVVIGVNWWAIGHSRLSVQANAAFGLVFLVLALCRSMVALRSNRADHSEPLSAQEIRRFERDFSLLSLCVGVCWAVWVFMGQHMPPNGQMTVASLIAGTVFVALGSIAVFPKAYLAFCIPPILALASIPIHDLQGRASYTPILSGSLLLFALVMLQRQKKVVDQSLRDAIRLRAIEQQQRHMFESGRAAIVHLDANKLLRISERGASLLGLTEQPGTAELRKGFKLSQEHMVRLVGRAQRQIARESMLSISGRFTRPDGAKLWLDLQVCAADAAHPERGLLVTMADATGRRTAEQHTLWLASHDSLTGLPNRVAFDKRLNALCSTKRDAGKNARFCVLSLDLNGFKAVNDNYGHQLGDETLKVIAKRLTHTLRATDLVARIGGDEFLVILERAGLPDQALRVSEALNQSVSMPIDLGGEKILLGVSIGIAVWPLDAQDAKELLRIADSKMYATKLATRQPRMSAMTGLV